MDIILNQAEEVIIHPLPVGPGKPSATITIRQGMRGRCHIEIMCGGQRREIAIFDDKVTIEPAMPDFCDGCNTPVDCPGWVPGLSDAEQPCRQGYTQKKEELINGHSIKP